LQVLSRHSLINFPHPFHCQLPALLLTVNSRCVCAPADCSISPRLSALDSQHSVSAHLCALCASALSFSSLSFNFQLSTVNFLSCFSQASVSKISSICAIA